MTTQWVEYNDVPLLDEHELTDDHGRVIAKIDRRKLERIADNMNRRVAETGDESPIIIGHTVDGKPETEQPEIVGYAKDFFVKKLGKSSKYAIHSKFRLMKSKKDTYSKFPRRSVELWLDRMEIDPIALLGATTPERNLGLLKYERQQDRGQSFHYSREVDEMPDQDQDRQDPKPSDKDKGECLTLEKLEQLDWVKFIKELMASIGSEADLGEPPMPDAQGGQPPMPPPGPQQMAAAAPAVGSVAPPQVMGQQQRQYARQQPAYLSPADEALLAENTNLKVRLAKLERRGKLQELVDKDGVELNIDEELNDTAEFNDRQFEGHLKRVKAKYARNPAARTQTYAAVNGPSRSRSEQPTDRESAIRAAELAVQKGIQYEDARRQLQGLGVEQTF